MDQSDSLDFHLLSFSPASRVSSEIFSFLILILSNSVSVCGAFALPILTDQTNSRAIGVKGVEHREGQDLLLTFLYLVLTLSFSFLTLHSHVKKTQTI